MTVRKKNWLEWTVFALGLALVLTVVGILVVHWVRHDDIEPHLSLEVEAAWRPEGVAPAHYVVPVTIHNDGDRAVELVLVELTLTRDGALLERSELRIPEVPRRSRRSGAWTLQQEPRAGELRARILGYSEP